MVDTKDRLKKLIHELMDEVLNEESTSSGAGAYMTPNAFTGGKAANEKKRKQTATVLGMKIVEPERPKSIKTKLDEITDDNSVQAGYLTKPAFSDGRASDKRMMKKTATVLGYKYHPSVSEDFVNTDDELLNEELAISENDYSREEFVPDQVYTSGEVSEAEINEEHYKGYAICNTSDGKFYSPDYDKNFKTLSLKTLEDVIDSYIEHLQKSQDADDDEIDPYAKAEREERDEANGLAEDTSITKTIKIDDKTGLKKAQVPSAVYNATPTAQKGTVGGKKAIVAKNDDGEATVNLVTT